MPDDAFDDTGDDTGDPVLREILMALDMPRAGLRAWFGQLQAFCDKHGGARRHYADLQELLEECQAELGRMESGPCARDSFDRGGGRAHRRPDPARR